MRFARASRPQSLPGGPRVRCPNRTQSSDPFNEQLLRPFTYCNSAVPDGRARRTSPCPRRRSRSSLYVLGRALTGGVRKTTNNGTTFEPFDGQARLSTAMSQWLPERRHRVGGTGDAFTSRSS
jgi:hypothetical protein